MRSKIKTIIILRKLLIKFFCFQVLILTSCNHSSFNSEFEFNLVQNDVFVDDSKQTILLILSDSDCYSCYESFSDIRNSKEVEYIGLFYSKYPDEFKKRTLQINEHIKWKQLKDNMILTALQKETTDHGPYIISLKNKELSILNGI